VRYQFSTEVNIRLSLASLPMLERFEDEIGQAIDYRRCGYLIMLTRPEELKVFEANLTLQRGLGVETIWLNGDEVRARLPAMRLDDVLGGTYNDKDGLVDPNSVVMGYIHAANRLGARTLTGVPVTNVLTSRGQVTGVETPLGEVSTGVMVDTAGPWAGQVSRMAGVDLPLTPLRRQMLTTS
jgi:sarcosine oxidase subunit beta